MSDAVPFLLGVAIGASLMGGAIVYAISRAARLR